MKCHYCGADIPEGTEIIADGRAFCNSLHRYSWESDKHSDAKSLPSLQYNHQETFARKGSVKVLSAILEATTGFEHPVRDTQQVDREKKSITRKTRAILFLITLVASVGAVLVIGLNEDILEPSENVFSHDSRTKNLISQAQEMVDATLQGEYNRLADFTFHRLVKACGGRDKIVSALRKGTYDMERSGCKIISYELQPIREMKEIGRQLVAVVPAAIGLQTPKGILRKESFLLAISGDEGHNWTFMDGSVLSKPSALRAFLPEVVGKITLPDIKEGTMTPN